MIDNNKNITCITWQWRRVIENVLDMIKICFIVQDSILVAEQQQQQQQQRQQGLFELQNC